MEGIDISARMSYEEALDFLQNDALPGSILELGPIRALLEELGNPHLKLSYVHIAGTSGKGSTCALISSVLRSAGYRTGLYTSPAVQEFNERFLIDGVQIQNSELAALTSELSEAVSRLQARGTRKPTFFELVTALAFLYFHNQRCDVVVLETGMGGALDATNVIETSCVSAITNIGLDHTDILGGTVEQIAAQKAGIIKEHGTVVLYSQSERVHKVIEQTCKDRSAALKIAPVDSVVVTRNSLEGLVFSYGRYLDLRIPFPGIYQAFNAAMAISIAEALADQGYKIDEAALRTGLKNAYWPGRFEILQRDPTVIVDGAHNPQKAEALMQSLNTLFPDKQIIFVIGMLSDKDVDSVIRLAEPLAKSFDTISPPGNRAMSAFDLANAVSRRTGKPIRAHRFVPEALRNALMRAEPGDVICIFGSLYQVGEVRNYFGRAKF